MTTIKNNSTKALYNLGVITIVGGIIVSVILAMSFGYTLDSYHFRMERNWAYTIGLFLGSLFSSVVLGLLLIAVSEILDSLETINNNIAKLGSNDVGKAVAFSGSSDEDNSPYNLFAVAEASCMI